MYETLEIELKNVHTKMIISQLWLQ